MTSLKGQVTFSCVAGRSEKRGESRMKQTKLHVVFNGIELFSGGIFLKPMLIYDQGIVKIQKMRKQRNFALTISMDL